MKGHLNIHFLVETKTGHVVSIVDFSSEKMGNGKRLVNRVEESVMVSGSLVTERTTREPTSTSSGGVTSSR